jgi:hypothetical protein
LNPSSLNRSSSIANRNRCCYTALAQSLSSIALPLSSDCSHWRYDSLTRFLSLISLALSLNIFIHSHSHSLRIEGSVQRIEVRIKAHGTLTELTVTNRRSLIRIEALVPLPPTENTKVLIFSNLFIYKVCKVLLKFVGFAFELILSLSLFMYEYVIEFIFILDW